MANFCRFCGNPVNPGAKFCRKCGKPLEDAADQKPIRTIREVPIQQPVVAAQMPDIAPEQDRPVDDAAEKKKTAKQSGTKTRSRTASKTPAAAVKQAGMIPKVHTLAAAATAGEIDFGVMDLPGLGSVTEPITKTLSPIAGIFHGIGSYIGGIFRIFKNPFALIGTLGLAALYYYLAQNRGMDTPVIKWLSLLTYAEGGFGRGGLDSVQGILGAVGGTLGMGTVTAALLSLFNGGLVRFFKGIGALFTGHGEKRSFISLLFGVILGGAAYFVFVGREPSEGSFIAGIAGALLSLQALGGGSGKLYTLAQSLTSRVAGGVRTAVQGKCDSLLTGLTLGFAIVPAVLAFL